MRASVLALAATCAAWSIAPSAFGQAISVDPGLNDPVPKGTVAEPADPASAPRRRILPRIEPRMTVQRPLWELGLGAAALSLPAYRGSDERKQYLLPLPYFVYRGKFLRADRDGARAVFIDSDRYELNLSVNASPPVRNDRGARSGMADLPATFEIGPNFNVALWRSNEKGLKVDLRLPVRAAITLQRSPKEIGEVFAPSLSVDAARFLSGWSMGLQTGPLFATKRYNQHYYSVGPGDATATRPLYEARGGYGGWQTTFATSRRIGNVFFGAFARYDMLGGARYADSPLVRRKEGLMVGFGFSYVFATSSEQVDVPAER